MKHVRFARILALVVGFALLGTPQGALPPDDDLGMPADALEAAGQARGRHARGERRRRDGQHVAQRVQRCDGSGRVHELRRAGKRPFKPVTDCIDFMIAVVRICGKRSR